MTTEVFMDKYNEKQLNKINLINKGDELVKLGEIEKAIKYYLLYGLKVGFDLPILSRLVKNLCILGRLIEAQNLLFLIAAGYPQKLNRSLFPFTSKLLPFLEENPEYYEVILESMTRMYKISSNYRILNVLSNIYLHSGALKKAINLNSLSSIERAAKEKKIHLKLENRNSFVSNRLPDFLLIGAQKTGTSALYQYIINNPKIFPALKKEIFFFSRDNFYKHGIDYYKSFFPCLDSESYLTGEGSATYFTSSKAAERIAANLPEVKLIFIFRNPAERAISDYYMNVRNGREKRTLQESILPEIDFLSESNNLNGFRKKCFYSHQKYVLHGIYVHFLKEFTKLFLQEKYIIICANHLKINPQEVMKNIFAFLGVDGFTQKFPLINTGDYSKKENDYLMIYHKLLDFYEPYNKELEELTGLNFGWN